MSEILMPDGTPAEEAAAPQIHVDDDWKAEAQREKERVSEDVKAQDEAAEAAQQMPEASFLGLLNSLAMQCVMAMGGMEDPKTKQRMVDLGAAQFHIDMLGLLQEKTKGNLDEEEDKILTQALGDLRMSYVQICQAIKAQGGQVPEELAPKEDAPKEDA
jgi:hypothetical protein